MERNNSKQVLLSVIGIAVLVVAIIGVSFAFFSYSRTGTNTNTIETGSIYMNFAETNSISLTNQFPMNDSEATSGLTGANQSMTFTVTGYSTGANAIPYTVYAVAPNPLDTPSGKTRFPNSQISIFLSSKPAGATSSVTTPTPVTNAVDSNPGMILATHSIAAGTPVNNPQTDSYTLKMFVNDTVRISDTDTSVTWNDVSLATTYCASDRVVTNNTYTSGCKLYLNNSTVTEAADSDSTSAHTYLLHMIKCIIH